MAPQRRLPLRRLTLRRGLLVVLAVLPLVLATAAAFGGSSATPGPGGGTPGTSSHFQLVGHDPLFGRGMNAALTIYGRYVYVGMWVTPAPGSRPARTLIPAS